MRVAITASGDSLAASVDARFGRAARFILFDTATRAFEVFSNEQNLNTPRGAGIQAAESVVRLGAEGLITGHCGPKAYRVLSAAGVRVYTGARGTVAEALKQFEDGTLAPAVAADVEGHWA